MPAAPPAWDFDSDGDFLLADGVEVVELSRLKSDGTYEAAVSVQGIREQADRKTAAGLMEAADLVWHLYAADVGDRGVRRGDRVRDYAGAEWDATGATLGGVNDQWRVPTLKVPASA